MTFSEWSNQKHKKKKEQEQDVAPSSYSSFADWSNAKYGVDVDDIAPVASIAPVSRDDDEEEERTWFRKGAFEDGYQAGDIANTLFGSLVDIGENVTAGILGMGEKAVDAGAYLVGGAAGLLGNDDFRDKTAAFIQKDLYNEEEIAKKIILGDEEYSVFGEKSDALVQSAGQLAGTLGLQMVGVPWFVTSGVTGFGSEAENALNQGASYGKAGLSATISAGAEILTEKLFGGSGLGEKGLIAVDALTKGITNKAVKVLADLGVDVVTEGSEEVVSEFMSNLGSSLYREENLGDILFSEEAVDGYIEAAIGGGALGGLMNTSHAVKAVKTGRDYRTGLTDNEQKVIDKVYNDELADAEKSKGKKLTEKEKAKLYDKVVEGMAKGDISTDVIEEVLGGDSYKAYQEVVKNSEPLQKAYNNLKQKRDALKTEYEALLDVKQSDKTDRQIARKAEIEKLLPGIEKQMANLKKQDQRPAAQKKLSESVLGLVANDRLAESYRQNDLRRQAYNADLSKYNDKQKVIIQNALDSGVLNNSRRAHEFVDMIAKIGADRGVEFEFLNNEKLMKSRFSREGAFVNGFWDKKNNTIGVNIDSKKALNAIVGHEITHVLEGTELYNQLQKTLFKYAKSKGEYGSRRDALAKLYSEDDIPFELAADLVGDYLFSDEDFVRHLSTADRNLFQKIWDEIKYLCKVATAGSEEARELEKVKRAFEKAYREGGKAQVKSKGEGNVKHSLSASDVIGSLYNQDTVSLHKVVIDSNIEEFQKKWDKGYYSSVVGDIAKHTGKSEAEVWDSFADVLMKNEGIAKIDGKTYINVHELNERQLREVFEMGGLAAPSIGIVDVDSPVTNFGDIALIFPDIFNPETVPTYYGDSYSQSLPAVAKFTDETMLRDALEYGFDGMEYSGVLSNEEIAELLDDLKQVYFYDEKQRTSHSISGNGFRNAQEFARSYDVKSIPGLLKLYNGLQGKFDSYQQFLEDFAEKAFTNKRLHKENTGNPIYDWDNRAYQFRDYSLDDAVEEMTARGEAAFKFATGEKVANYDEMLSAGMRAKLKSQRGGYYETKPQRAVYLDEATYAVVPESTSADVIEKLKYEGIEVVKYTPKDGYTGVADGRAEAIKGILERDTTGIRYSLSDSKGRELSPAAANRVAKSKAVDEDGNLKVLYHGTAAGEFYTFDKAKANVEGDYGSGFYFTDNEWDVSDHYEGGGPDFELKVGRRADEIYGEEDIEYAEAEKRARDELYKGDFKHEVYLNIENPATVGETILFNPDDYYNQYSEDDYDSYEDYEGDVEQLVSDDIDQIIWDIERNVDISSTDGIAEIVWEAISEGGIGLEELKAKLNNLYLEDSNGNLVANEVARQIVESLGYDGIIDPTVSGKWNMDIEEGTTHYIAFKPNQIKAVSNQNPTDDPDIRYSLSADAQAVDDFGKSYLDTKSIKFSYSAVPSHKKSLLKNYNSKDSAVDLDTIVQRYDKILGIWEKLGGELDSKFLNDWNNKVERPFTIFKAQAGYKYNVELSSMCKKGVPLFEAIDTIVKKEVMKELNTDVLGKEEKEILYDILKKHDFEIPCAICYVEQARQREGVIIDAFLNGKTETNANGDVTGLKLGWNQMLDAIESEMKANGVDHNFAFVSRDIATDKYMPADLKMDEKTYAAFAEAVKKLANEEIVRYNQTAKNKRPLLKDVTPEAVKKCFKGTLPSNLKIFKVLLTEPSSRFKIQGDLLYSSMTTKNLTMDHNGLYSLFNSQGGVSGYKTKQAPTVYWGEILGKKWKPSDTRKEGGVRNQSNSDFQMYTLLDQAQMYIDFTAKGYYLQAYTKVLSELKLFGLSRGKINASLIPKVKVYRNADGTVDVEKTMANAGLDENGNLFFDDVEGINHKEAFMLVSDPEYSKNISGICIGYSDNHISKLLDDNRVQLIIGFHDKTNDPDKRYYGARYAKNYNGLNEAVNLKDGKTVHIGFNPFVKKAEQKFEFNEKTETFEGTVNYNGKSYAADDIPRLAAELYKEHCAKKGYAPAYEAFAEHPNYYKLLADFGLYDSQGHYAPHRKVVYNMPDQVPYLDADGNKQYMDTEAYIKKELQSELAVRDALCEAMADTSENGIIPQFKAEVNRRNSIAPTLSLSNLGETPKESSGWNVYGKDIAYNPDIAPVAEDAAADASLPTDVAPMGEDEPVQAADQQQGATSQETNKAVDEKIRNFQTELERNVQLREQAAADYDADIEMLQAEYDALKNKTTLKANNLLRRIERTKRLKANADVAYEKRIGDLESRIQKMNTTTYRTAAQRKAKQGEHFNWAANLIGDTSTWVDKKLGIQYATNTLRRNLRDIVRDASGNKDIAKADAIDDALSGEYNHNEADLKRESAQIKKPFADLKLTDVEDAYVQMLGEFRHNPDTELTKEAVQAFYEKNKANIDEAKVDRAIEMARQSYDSLLERVNTVLREQGMKEIPYRKGYFPHFTEEPQSKLAKLLNWKTQKTDIPTSIAGLTEQFNPNRSWQSFNKQRKGDTTDYSFTKGFDAYAHGALDWIYHIEDIQKRRAVENYIRYTHSEEGVKSRIDAIRANDEYDAFEAQEQIELVLNEANNPLNNFVTDFRTGTNILANKKSSFDRGVEQWTNRHIYSVMTNLSNRVSANMVAGSVSSAMTNFIPITQSWGEVSPISSLRAMGDTIRAMYRDDGVVDKSDFLTNRLRTEENLHKTTWDKIGDKVGIMTDVVDNFTSQTVWRSKYLENISKGMSEAESIKNADQFAENVIAGRSRGNMPTIFNAKNPLAKTLTAFQLEVANQYGYMFKDMPTDLRNEATGKLVKGYATMFVGAYAYNALYSSLAGRDAAFDPIGILEDLLRDLGFGDEEEEEPADVVLNFAGNIAEELPFVGGLLGGGRIPISAAIPYSGEYEGLEGFVTDVANNDWKSVAKELANPLYYLAMPMGGGQIRKTVQGLQMFSDDHPVAGSYTDSGNLRYPVEDTFLNRLQAGVFGQYANANARDYFDNNRSPLKEKQIQEYIDVDIPIQEYWDYRDGLKDQDTLEEKFDYVAGLNLPIGKKNILINNIVDRKEDVDMTLYDEIGNYEEFDFYAKNTEKYNFLKEQGVSYSTYKADKDEKQFYDSVWSWYKDEDNAGKVKVAKAVSDNMVEYRQYTSELNDIHADKDASGKSISGSRKTKVFNYINNLDVDYGAKLILWKSEYPSDDSYNYEICEYLDSRDDLSNDEKVTIMQELGFIVGGDGTITW